MAKAKLKYADVEGANEKFKICADLAGVTIVNGIQRSGQSIVEVSYRDPNTLFELGLLVNTEDINATQDSIDFGE